MSLDPREQIGSRADVLSRLLLVAGMQRPSCTIALVHRLTQQTLRIVRSTVLHALGKALDLRIEPLERPLDLTVLPVDLSLANRCQQASRSADALDCQIDAIVGESLPGLAQQLPCLIELRNPAITGAVAHALPVLLDPLQLGADAFDVHGSTLALFE